MSLGLGVLGVVSQLLSYRLLNRVVVRVTARIDETTGDEVVVVRHLTLFGQAESTYRRQGVVLCTQSSHRTCARRLCLSPGSVIKSSWLVPMVLGQTVRARHLMGSRPISQLRPGTVGRQSTYCCPPNGQAKTRYATAASLLSAVPSPCVDTK